MRPIFRIKLFDDSGQKITEMCDEKPKSLKKKFDDFFKKKLM